METKKLLIPNRAMQVLAPISLYTTSQRQPLGSVLPGMITSPEDSPLVLVGHYTRSTTHNKPAKCVSSHA